MESWLSLASYIQLQNAGWWFGAMFDSMVLATRDFETSLKKQSRQYARYRREQNPNLVFMDIKPPVVPGVELLLQPCGAEIEVIDPEENKLVLTRACPFDANGTITCNGQVLDVIHHEEDALWVTDISPFAIGMRVAQVKHIGTHDELAAEFIQVWRERWMRHVDVPAQRWEQIIAFARTHLPPGRFDWSPLNEDGLLDIIHHKKNSTSAGFDGVTVHDLKHMSRPIMKAFCDIFASAESNGVWPSQLVDGKVVSLAKVPAPSTPSDFRPITIFSLLYRCWSSHQARKALQCLHDSLPDTLYGSRPGRHAAQIWTRMLWTIEESFLSNIPMSGAVADLAKAFNYLPRVVVMELAAHMGLPGRVLLAWTGALTQMKRRFQLRDTLTEGLCSVTGVPEGCGLSCVAMVVIDACFHKWMQVFFPLCSPVSFVDDWQVLTCSPTLLEGAVACMQKFADAMDLILDSRKAYAWSICPSGRKLLRNQGFKVVLGGKNLGAHIQMARKHTNAAIHDRIEGMAEVWPRLRLSACRYPSKIRALVASAWPKALHAIAAVQVAEASFHKLRTGAMRGLHADQAGANAWIQMGLIEQAWVDPQCWAILQTFRCIRECGDDQYIKNTLVGLVNGGDQPPAHSFTTTLLHRIQMLGWSVNSQGLVVDVFGSFCLFHVCMSELRFRLQWAWQNIVAQQVQHRPGLRDLAGVDSADTRDWLNTLSYDNQELFKKCLNGTHITQDGQKHCQENGSDKCPYCDCTDSRFHRFWVCEHFAAERASVSPDVLSLIVNMPETLSCYGWSLKPWTLQRWFAMLHSIPVPAPVLLPQVHDDLHLFTDGSCFNQHEVNCRVASWAVVFAEAGGFHGEVIDAGPLPGLIQSAYRAEVFAIMRALQIGRVHQVRVFLWTDCKAVVSRLNKLLRGHTPRPNSPHADLWREIYDCIHDCGPDRIQITKVAAHQSMEAVQGPLEEWCAFHNHLADSAAVAANRARPGVFWTLYSQHVGAVEATRDLSRVVQHVLLAISKTVVRDLDAVVEEERQDLCAQPEIPSHAEDPLPPLSIPHAAVRWYGLDMVKLVLSWFWMNVFESNHPVIWMSHYQLYIDFMLSGEVGPVKLQRWQLGTDDPAFDLLSVPFQTRTRRFSKVLKECLRHQGAGYCFRYCRPTSNSFHLHTGCLAVRWNPERLAAIDEWVLKVCPGGVSRTTKAITSWPCAGHDARFPKVCITGL